MSLFKNRRLLALSLGHFGVDMYPNILPVLYPLLVASLGLSYTLVGVLQLVYAIASSLLQPVFGHLADRHGGRYFAAGGVLTTSILIGLLGFAWDYPSLLVIIFLSALGPAAFHPQGSMNTAAVTSRNQRATAMSIFMLGGNLGFAVGPVLGAGMLASPWGLHGTALLPIPGVVIALWLQRLMIKVDQAKRAAMSRPAERVAPVSRHAIVALVAVIGVVMLRSWSYQSLTNFLPLWYHDRGLPQTLAPALLFVMLISGAIGGLLGGYLADRFGRRRVVAISLFLASPALLLFLTSPDGWSFPVGAVAGFTLGSSNAVTLVIAQELLPRSMGVASGLILGFAFVTGGIGATATGWIADSYGLVTALNSLIPLPLVAALVCVLLPADLQKVPTLALRRRA